MFFSFSTPIHFATGITTSKNSVKKLFKMSLYLIKFINFIPYDKVIPLIYWKLYNFFKRLFNTFGFWKLESSKEISFVDIFYYPFFPLLSTLNCHFTMRQMTRNVRLPAALFSIFNWTVIGSPVRSTVEVQVVVKVSSCIQPP